MKVEVEGGARRMSDFDLTRYLPYLINRTGIRIASTFTEAIRAHGITLQMWRVLAALDHADGQRVSDLAALTSIDVSTLSRILDAMQEKSLIERRRGNGRGSVRERADARVAPVGAHLGHDRHARAAETRFGIVVEGEPEIAQEMMFGRVGGHER